MSGLNPKPHAGAGEETHHGARRSSLEIMRTVVTSLITASATAVLIGYFSIVISVEDLTIFYRLTNSTEIGKSALVVTFSLSNMGRQGALIEEFGLLQIVGDDVDDDVCKDPDVISQLNYRRPASEQLLIKKQQLLSYHVPNEVFVDNVKSISGSVAVNASAARKVDMTFEIVPFDLSKQSTSLCPVIRYFDRSGHAIISVCPGWTRDPVGNGGVSVTQAIGSRALRLLPPERSLSNTLFWRRGDSFCASVR